MEKKEERTKTFKLSDHACPYKKAASGGTEGVRLRRLVEVIG